MFDDDSCTVLKDQDSQANKAARMKAAAERDQQTATPSIGLSSGSSAFSSIKTWSVPPSRADFAQLALPPSRADATAVEEACRRLRENDSTLTKLDRLGNKIGKEGATALAEALKSNTTLQTLNLTYNDIGMEGAAALAEALKSSTTLQMLNLSYTNIGKEGATALAEALTSNTTLQFLNLSYTNIGKEGDTALAEGLKSNTTLQTLNLSYTNIGNDGAAALAEALKNNNTLQTLNLLGNWIGKDGATALAEGLKSNTTLQELYLRSNNIGNDGAAALAEALTSNTTLRMLNLRTNNIGNDCAAALAEALKHNTTLQWLDLGSNWFGKDGATALAEGLKSNTTLQELDLRSNNIGNDGAAALAEALKSNTTLQELNLGWNQIGKDGAAALAAALKSNTTLKRLDLRANNIGKDGATALAEALKSNTTLQELYLARNSIGNEGARELLQMLRKHNGTLTSLHLFYNGIDDETMDEIHALVKANKDGTRNPPPQPLKWEAEQLLTEGSTLHANKEYEAALGKYMEAKQLRPIQSAQTWIEIASCHEQLFQFDEMASAAKSCIGVDPTMPLGYYLLAVAHSKAGNVTAALEVVETGLRQLPNDQLLVALKNSLGQQHIAPEEYANGENAALLCLADIANEERDLSEAAEHPTMTRGLNSFTVAHSNSKASNREHDKTVQPNKRKSLCADNDTPALSGGDSIEPSLQAPKRPRVEPPLLHQHAVAAGRAEVDAGATAVAALPPPPQQHNENDVASHTWAPSANLPLYPLATSSRVIVADLSNVTTQISKQLETLQVEATYFNQTATARLESPENVVMHLALWRTSDRPGILVELQLREGLSELFHIYSRSILNAATGKTPPPPPQWNNENDVTSRTLAPTANLPLYQDATRSCIIVDDLSSVKTRISKQLKMLEVKATNFNETATARLETPENDIMHLALWRTSDRPDGILVELQLREGRLESFPVYSRLILNAAAGETASAVVALPTRPQIAFNAPQSSRPWHAVDWSKKSKHTVEGLIANAWRALVKRLRKEKLGNRWDKIKVVAYYREQFLNDLKRIHQAVSEGNEVTLNANEKHLYTALQCLRRQSSDGRLEQLPSDARGLQFFGKYGRMAGDDALYKHIRDVRRNQKERNEERRRDTIQPLPTIGGEGTISHADSDPASTRLRQEGNSKHDPTGLHSRGEIHRQTEHAKL